MRIEINIEKLRLPPARPAERRRIVAALEAELHRLCNGLPPASGWRAERITYVEAAARRIARAVYERARTPSGGSDVP